MYKLDLEKAEEPKIKLQTFIGLWKKAREFQKNIIWGLVAQTVKCLPTMWENWVRSLGQKDPLEKEMATNSTLPAWRIPWTDEPGGLQSMGSQRVRHDEATFTFITC